MATTWVKPNGKDILINDTDACIEYAISLGWKTKEIVESEQVKDVVVDERPKTKTTKKPKRKKKVTK